MSDSHAVDLAPQIARKESGSPRLVSLDAFRGAVMLTLLLDGYFPALASRFPEHPFIQAAARQFDHVDWQGFGYWDLIQPSFMFMVGVAMTYSFRARQARGQDRDEINSHVLIRSGVFIILGLLLASIHAETTQWKFGELLCQIGLAYPFASLFLGRTPRTQWIGAAVILTAVWLAFALYPLPGPGFDYARWQVSPIPEPYTGFFAHWNKYTNVAVHFDRWFLNRFPRPDIFLGNEKYGATLNFIPSIVTILFGIMAGDWLRGEQSREAKLRRLLVAGACSFAFGMLLWFTICPVIKSLWTPSYVMVTTGIICWCLGGFYWMADIKGWVSPLFPALVAGRNSLVIYLMFRACGEPIRRMLQVHLSTFGLSVHIWSFEVLAAALIMWLVCLWLYRKQIFISV